ncbi:hypothetical protein BAU15_12390 [Enterococcus sp. JM4C]|uniref:helix-turn-helix domain-containing protein n=1 Tax=Candidatus Enterococcus huntleyi TaxID=1857217 RepID=UPI00137B74D9|nr:helix-turn-helix transcriptional regulator [Enterococcus sp. JM4C]KAF1296071.1 hypothetical protein BAU15_12390 [Enterococcus sp. JM4C]
MEHGKLIKKLRTDRKISRESLAKGIHSVSTLQRFENSSSKVDIDTLWLFLDRMNVRMDEYYAEFHNYQPTKKDFLRESFSKSMVSASKAKGYLENLQNEYQKKS